MKKARLRVVYDGDCPFCTRYTALVTLREAFEVSLVDTRAEPEVAQAYAARGYDVNEGMIVELEGSVHFGADAVCLLSELSDGIGLGNRLLSALLRNRRFAHAVYPALRLGRAATLAALGRRRPIA